MTEKLCGVLNVDKPKGVTSRQVVDRVVRLVRPAKAGHAGTLDPLATGVLVVCVGRATRLIHFVQDRPKTYRATFLLGRTSPTDDLEGEVVERADATPVDRAAIEAALPRFTGRIPQVPPAFSAVHVGGRRAYDLARKGRNVELEARTVEIHRLQLLDYDWPRLDVEIECGSGTYVRSLGRDLGEELGCGALMSDLARTAIGPFTREQAVELDALTPETLPQHLLPPAAAVAHLPHHECTPKDATDLSHGKQIAVRTPLACPNGDFVAVHLPDERLVCIAVHHADEQRLAPKHVFPVESD